MIIRASDFQALPRAAAAFALLSLGLSLSGCADMGDGMSQAFADPAKYDLYDCKQLETERKNLASRSAELQGLMSKAETGFAGPIVAEVAYRNEAIAVRGQSHFAEEAWRKNKCHESPPAPVAAPAKSGLHVKSAKLSKPGQPFMPAPAPKADGKTGAY